MKFSDIIGQQEMAQRLMTLADENRLPHAMMLCGPDGAGKMALALALATYILDKGDFKVRGIEHPDLHFTFPTIKPKNATKGYKPISTDYIAEWRELMKGGPYFSLSQWMTAINAERQQSLITVGEANDLIKKLSMKSNRGGYKINIIWLPERMNLECANTLLKMIEEPPTETLFIMVCREPEKLLETIRSRVQRFDVKPIEQAEMIKALKERRGLNDDDAQRIARLAGGNWLKAIDELKEDSETHLFFDCFVTLMRQAYKRDLKEMKRWTDTVSAMGREEQKRMLTYFLRMVREAFMYNFRNRELIYMTTAEEAFCEKFACFVHERNVLGFQELYQKAIQDIAQNANPKMVFFDISLKVAVLLHTT